MRELIKPSFIGIGAPRCGTRWMSQCLAEHPQVAIPEGEVYYFTRRRVVASYWHEGPLWYDQRLRAAIGPSTRAVGEITPVYLFDDDTPGLIHAHSPDAKLICCVRDQAQRAESWYRLFLRFNPTITAEAYPLEKFLTYQNDVYGREGFYLEHLSRFWQHFPREQILLLAFDDLERDPGGFIRRVFKFIGVDSDWEPPATKRRINRLAPRVTTLSMRAAGPAIDEADSLEAVEHFRMASELRKRMRDLYSEHNKRLGELIGRDLSHWNTLPEEANGSKV